MSERFPMGDESMASEEQLSEVNEVPSDAEKDRSDLRDHLARILSGEVAPRPAFDEKELEKMISQPSRYLTHDAFTRVPKELHRKLALGLIRDAKRPDLVLGYLDRLQELDDDVAMELLECDDVWDHETSGTYGKLAYTEAVAKNLGKFKGLSQATGKKLVGRGFQTYVVRYSESFGS